LPSFDQAVSEGEVALNVVESQLSVKGIGLDNSPDGVASIMLRETGGMNNMQMVFFVDDGGGTTIRVAEDPDNMGYPAIFAEMQQNGITVSLANIQMAKKLQSFAKMRERFTGLSDDVADEYIIDMLMSGLRILDQSLT